MRSNDIYRGFPGDVFAFTFIQELVANTLGLEVGNYSHFVGSLHLYDCDEPRARDYLSEGFQSPISMPPMPHSDPWPSVSWLLRAEQLIRSGSPVPPAADIDSYWVDLARLLRMKYLFDKKDRRQLIQVKNEMTCPEYAAFVRGRHIALQRNLDIQLKLPGIPTVAQEENTP